ncbi:MAG: ABC transporter ATP-binding protein [Myxococcaceae bacterium]
MIEVQGLTKYYGESAAISDLSFNIARGEVVGLLGLNGAGKTTTLKVLGCVLLPTSGSVRIDGFEVSDNPHDIRKRIGLLPDTPPLYGEMTVGAYLRFVAQLRGVSKKDVTQRVSEAEDITALRDVHNAVIGELSHGYRQRVGVAQALVHRPSLLILDEPTSGLDPVQIVEMRSLIKRLKGDRTVLVSSHILSEISQTCDRLLVIHQGKLVASGTEEELSRGRGTASAVELDVRSGGEHAAGLLRALSSVGQVRVLREEAGVATLRVESTGASGVLAPQLAKTLINRDVDLLRLSPGAEGLENIFLKLTQGASHTEGPRV